MLRPVSIAMMGGIFVALIALSHRHLWENRSYVGWQHVALLAIPAAITLVFLLRQASARTSTASHLTSDASPLRASKRRGERSEIP